MIEGRLPLFHESTQILQPGNGRQSTIHPWIHPFLWWQSCYSLATRMSKLKHNAVQSGKGRQIDSSKSWLAILVLCTMIQLSANRLSQQFTLDYSNTSLTHKIVTSSMQTLHLQFCPKCIHRSLSILSWERSHPTCTMVKRWQRTWKSEAQ